MDQVSSTFDDAVNTAEFSAESDTLASPLNTFLPNKKISQHNGLEMNRTCIRPMNTDDIISKELPFKILDTDFDGKDEDSVFSPAESQLLLREPSESTNDEPEQPYPKISDEQFKADILEQDTGYSSDSGENVKSASSGSIDLVETKEVDDESSESVTSIANQVEPEARATGIASTTDSEAISDQESTDTNKDDFVPTIVGIRGAYDSTASTSSNPKEVDAQTPSSTSMQQINIVHVQGSREEDPELGDLSSTSAQIYTVDDDDDDDDTNTIGNQDITSSYSTDLVIKQEPPEMVDNSDDMYDSAQNEDGQFTSEIFIEEEQTKDKQEEEEVICLDSSGKIPLPIPIKTEARIEVEEQNKTSQSATVSKESKLPATPMRTFSAAKNTVVLPNAGYTCHMCNTTFQEYESLNDHMTMHRNNLVDPNKMKPKMKPTCPICSRQLSTVQSLQQHIRIHNEEKPLVCKICNKAFRHQTNYKMHLQKHDSEKAQKMRGKVAARKNVPLAPRVDRYKPVSYIFSAPVTNQATKTNTPKVSYGASSTYRRDNAKENVNLLYRSFTSKNRGGELITRTRVVDDTDDDVIPLKTFNNVENIVMNAARFIVKVDSIDPNVLKRRIKTPDISIDKNAIGEARRPGEKSKIVLSPSDNSKRLKLDQIENIIMDNETPADFALPDDDQDYDYGDDYGDIDSDTPEADPIMETTWENVNDSELIFLREEDYYVDPHQRKAQEDYVSELRRNAQMIMKNEAEKSRNSKPSSSNVIMLSSSLDATSPNQDVLTEAPYESYSFESSDDENVVNDAFDKAFRRVALRRLLLIQKRAAKNNGKVDSKYLLGPRFWRKALRRAKLNPVNFDFDVDTFTETVQSLASNSVDAMPLVDERHTNDPKRLQVRAESKLSYMLDKIRLTNNMSNVNLIGPLFWKKTLQLAGIHRPIDLPALLDKEQVSLQDVEFINDEFSFSRKNKNANASSETDPVRTNIKAEERRSSDSIDCDSSNQNSALVNSILSDVAPPRSPKQSIKNEETTSSLKTSGSILYESLTKPLILTPKSPERDAPETSNTDEQSEGNGAKNGPKSPNVVDSKPEIISANCASDVPVEKVADAEVNENVAGVEMDPSMGAANIVLNVDENFQLQIAPDGNKLTGLSDGSNYVLVSYDSGAMQLVKENDLRLVESNDANGDAQYVVNLQGENYSNIDLMGQANGGQELSYALQFDGENYTAIQLVQNDVAADEKPDGELCGAAATLKTAEAEETTSYVLPAVATDLNNIDKELSDFLNLNYET